MARQDDDGVWHPTKAVEAVDRAVKRILAAAKDLTKAADLAAEGEQVSHLINAAIRLRDLASFLSPNEPSWPTDGAKIYDIKTKKQVN